MQPYFLPYIGYFQLMLESEVFVIYDNIKYTKKGWINRNRMLRNGEATVFSLPLKSAPDNLEIRERELAGEFDPKKILAQISGVYRRAPFFESTMSLMQDILLFPSRNLFEYIYYSIESLRNRLQIGTPLVICSSLDADHSLRGQDRVLKICRALNAKKYVNPPGGRALYDNRAFLDKGIELAFIEPNLIPYPQFGASFVPALSILDVLMFNSAHRIREELLPAYEVVEPDTR